MAVNRRTVYLYLKLYKVKNKMRIIVTSTLTGRNEEEKILKEICKKRTKLMRRMGLVVVCSIYIRCNIYRPKHINGNTSSNKDKGNLSAHLRIWYILDVLKRNIASIARFYLFVMHLIIEPWLVNLSDWTVNPNTQNIRAVPQMKHIPH